VGLKLDLRGAGEVYNLGQSVIELGAFVSGQENRNWPIVSG
jgi:hypothetical protein